jgi:hypothetical protein
VFARLVRGWRRGRLEVAATQTKPGLAGLDRQAAARRVLSLVRFSGLKL